MEQILANTPSTLVWKVYRDGDLTALEASPAPAVTAVDANGTSVTVGAVNNPTTGVYEVNVDAGDPTVIEANLTGELATDLTFAPPAQVYEVVGGHLFTEAEARAYDGGAMSNTTTYTDDAIAAARAAITDDLESWTGRAWVPRHARASFAGNGQRRLWLGDGYVSTASGRRIARPGRCADVRRILSVTVDGVSVATSNVVIQHGWLHRTDTTWPAASTTDPLNVVVEWEYGLEPYTYDSNRIALMLLRHRLVPSSIDDRALSFSDELGTLRLVTAGGPMGNYTSIPDVNAFVQQHNLRLPF